MTIPMPRRLPVHRLPVRRPAVAAALIAVACLIAPGLAIAEGSPDIRVEARLEPRTATVGDPLKLEIEVTSPRGGQVLPPALTGKTGDLVVLEAQPPADLPSPDPGHARRVFRYTVAAYRPGDFELPALEVAVRPQSGAETRASSAPVKITIRSVLTGKDPQLRDLKKQAELAPVRPWLPWALGAAALVLAAAAWWWWRSRRRPGTVQPRPEAAPPEDPFLAAEHRLDELQRQDLPGKGRVKEHYVELSEIARRVLEAGCSVATLERTTEEILAELREKGAFPEDPSGLQRVQALLDLCDMVKFAKYVSTATENDSALQVARRLLEDCRQQGRAVAASATK
jgi:hypothetical protein